MELVEHTKMALMHSDSLGQHFSKHTSPSLKQYLSPVGLVRSCSRMCRQQFSRQHARTTNCRCNDGQEGDDCSRFPFSAVDPYHAASPPVAPGGHACSHSLTMPMFRMQELHAKQDPACSSRRRIARMHCQSLFAAQLVLRDTIARRKTQAPAERWPVPSVETFVLGA